MGCDIHCWGELFRNGRWHVLGEVFPGDEYDDGRGYGPPQSCHPVDARNYALFSLLAGVRGTLAPILPPKGFPPDASPEVLAEYTLRVVSDLEHEREEREGAGGTCTLAQAENYLARAYSNWVVPGERIKDPDWHTPSWLSLDELLAFDWNQPVSLEWEPEYKTYGDVAGFLINHTIPAMVQCLYGDAAEVVMPLVATALRGEKAVLAILERDWLVERDLPALGHIRMVFFFDN